MSAAERAGISGSTRRQNSSVTTHDSTRIAKVSIQRRATLRLGPVVHLLVLAGISTLTLIHTGSELRFLMHVRGTDETAFAQGTHHVIPAGEFQPSCIAPALFRDDLDLWKNVMREYAEVVPGLEEYDGNSSTPFDYESEPYASMEKERLANGVVPFYLGTCLDPITLQGEILTACPNWGATRCACKLSLMNDC